ncbi:MAG TPA: hypothetical protein VNR40_01270, partial [Steroidobacter sp.]|nr:hypothetical protein [Steroidobacter sp.]
MRFAVNASKMAALSAIGLIAALPLGSAYAACTRPNFKISIPDGAAATEAEMKTAAQALVKVDQEMSEYLRCIKGDASQSTV